VSFAAVVATSFCFVLRALVVDDWGRVFALSETQKGELLGVGLWPFAISIVLLSFVIDRIGFRRAFWFAAACHIAGLVTMFLANGYWMLYWGTFIMALGNGAVEAAANPLVATLFPDDRPTWLNRLHAAWPGGMIVGGVLAITLGTGVDWRVKVGLMLLPVAVYGVLLLGRAFPRSAREVAGIAYRTMLADAGVLGAFVIIALMMMEIGRVLELSGIVTALIIVLLSAGYYLFSRSIGRPLYLILVLIMIPLAITELSTDGWIVSLMTPELEQLGVAPGWVLVYTATIVFVVRIFAGAVIRRLTPLGTLAGATLFAGVGLVAMSGATGLVLLAAATLYGIGKSFFWGTSLAVVSDQFPRGGAVTMNMMAGAGMLAAGIVGSVFLGTLQDQATWRSLRALDQQSGSRYVAQYLGEERHSTLGRYHAVDPARVAVAPAADRRAIAAVEVAGKREALASVALLPFGLTIVYLLLLVRFHRRGGYRPIRLSPANEVGA